MSTISIIIPVYNAEQYISRCLNSVLCQTYQDFEVILINDGSKDGSFAICEMFCAKDSRFHVLNKENGGAASARNLGLDWYYQHDPGSWLCFLDIDDFILPQYLELLLTAAREQHTKISMCSYKTTTNDRLEPVDSNAMAMAVDTETLWCEHQINCTIPWAKLFARDLFRDIRFPEGIIHEDEFTLYRVLFQCEKIAYLDLPLYGYYQTQTSVMRGAWTPRHMTEPDGLFAQLQFFQQNGYQQAAAYTAKIYLFSLYNNLTRCRAAGTQYVEYSAALKKRLRSEFGRCRKLAGIRLQTEPWLYYEAWPLRTIPVRVLNRVRHSNK